MLSYELTTKHQNRLINVKHPGFWIFWGVAFMAIPLWMLSYPETSVKHNIKPFFIYASQLFSITGFALFSLSLILATRLKFLEDLFGGLDKVYEMHRSMGKTAFVLLLAHPVFLAFRWIPEDLTKALWFLLPLHRRMEIDLGSWSLWGMIFLLSITVWIKIPYDKWKITHKIMGFFFVLGVAHLYFQGISFSENPALKLYLGLLSVVGISSWLYKSILFDVINKKSSFLVIDVQRLNESTVEIELRPQKKPEEFIPGQFYFFSFLSHDLSAESHPFTICNRSQGGDLKIIVKSLGDFTRKLHKEIEPGVPALLEGPYGRFFYDTVEREQVWIAGGVGIAPFLSWGNYLLAHPDVSLRVHLFYCVKNRTAAIHLQTFKELEKKIPGFHVQVISEESDGFLKVTDLSGLQEKEIFICGPNEMRKTVLKELKQLKVPKKQIHFENFDFN